LAFLGGVGGDGGVLLRGTGGCEQALEAIEEALLHVETVGTVRRMAPRSHTFSKIGRKPERIDPSAERSAA
jgi:hypothetical protein